MKSKDEIRMEVWAKAWCATAQTGTVMTTCKAYAESCLIEFDRIFEKELEQMKGKDLSYYGVLLENE